MLTVSSLCANYGAIEAVKGVSLRLGRGQLVTLLGANGAGKSTILRSLCGLHRSKRGTIRLADKDVSNVSTYKAIRAGIALVPEGRMVVATLTVQENLLLSRFAKRGDAEVNLSYVFELFPRLMERSRQIAGLLSGGEQQMLALGRALMTEPEVLMLDEPSTGLAPSVVDTVYGAILRLHDDGQSILLVEQNAALALPVADYGYVIHRGSVAFEGTPTQLNESESIREAYLG